MFKNPKKTKHFPPGTFIPSAARVVAILHLCIAFTVLIWNLSLPFMGEAYNNRAQSLAYHSVMGGNDSIESEQIREKFQNLPLNTKQNVLNGFHQLQTRESKGFFEKLLFSISIILFRLPPFEMAWLCLSFIIPIMLLKQVPSGRIASLLLPLVTLIYCADNMYFGKSPVLSRSDQLYPSENYLIEKYVEGPLSDKIMTQHAQLKNAWHLYLVNEWASPQSGSHFEQLLEDGKFSFNLARVQLMNPPALNRLSLTQEKEPFLYYILYLFWNALFSYTVIKYVKPSDYLYPKMQGVT